MKTSNVNLVNLLDQLSEEKINRVVDEHVIRAGWTSGESSKHSDRSVRSSSNPGRHLGNDK